MGDAKIEGFLPPFLESNAVVTALRDTYSRFTEKRDALGLSYPGTVENIAREVQKDVFLTNAMFTGLRADFTKPLGIKPLFQYAHAFSMGSQGIPPYNFSALFGTDKVFPPPTPVRTTATNSYLRYSCKAIWIMTVN